MLYFSFQLVVWPTSIANLARYVSMVNVRHLVLTETHVDSTPNVKQSNTKRDVPVLHLSPETEKLNVSEFQILVSQIRAVPTK